MREQLIAFFCWERPTQNGQATSNEERGAPGLTVTASGEMKTGNLLKSMEIKWRLFIRTRSPPKSLHWTNPAVEWQRNFPIFFSPDPTAWINCYCSAGREYRASSQNISTFLSPPNKRTNQQNWFMMTSYKCHSENEKHTPHTYTFDNMYISVESNAFDMTIRTTRTFGVCIWWAEAWMLVGGLVDDDDIDTINKPGHGCT